MATVRKLPIFKREIVERISPAGLEVFLAASKRISEGKLEDDGVFYGSTMLTLDLHDPGARIRAARDPGAARRMATLLDKDRKLRRRLERLGLEEACRVAGGELQDPEVDLRISSQGSKLLLDIDVQGTCRAELALNRSNGGAR